MRHVKARRRFKTILIAALAFSMILFFESRVESFAPQLRTFAESRIEAAFDQQIVLSIGDLKGGIIHPLTVTGCTITDGKGAARFSSVEVESIRSNYRVWDFLFNPQGPLALFMPLSPTPRIDITFSAADRSVRGFMRIEGKTIEDAKVRGFVTVFKDERVEFSGRTQGKTVDAELRSRFGTLTSRAVYTADGAVDAEAALNHLDVQGFDVVCNVAVHDRPLKDAGPGDREGTLETTSIIVNHKPFENITAAYQVRDGVITLSSVTLGRNIRISGKIVPADPPIVDLVITVDNANIAGLFAGIGTQQEPPLLSGTLNGRFALKGSLEDPALDASMEIRQGKIKGLDFEFLTARLKGEGPILRIEESRITRKSGAFVLAGEINLSRAAKGNAFEHVKIVSDDMALMWDGMKMVRHNDTNEVTMEKKVSEELNFGFKRFETDARIDESLRDTDEFEVEYKLHAHDSLKLKVGEDKDFFGLAYEDKF